MPLALLLIAVKWMLVGHAPPCGRAAVPEREPGRPRVLPFAATYALLAGWLVYMAVLFRALLAYETLNAAKLVYLGTQCAVVTFELVAPGWGVTVAAGIHGLEYYLLTRKMLAPTAGEGTSRLTAALCWPAMIAAMSPILVVGVLRNPFVPLDVGLARSWPLMLVNACVLAHYCRRRVHLPVPHPRRPRGRAGEARLRADGRMTSARLFVAIDPAPAVRDRLRAALAPVRRLAPSAKWVDVASLHLTLAFLGDVEVPRVPEIAAAIGGVAAGHAPFELGCAGAGAFGGKRPRVLWAGVPFALDALAAVHGDLAAALAPLGFAPEPRPFAAHLTLARAREARGDPALAACAAALAGQDFGVTRVEALVLYRSDLSPKGPAYRPLASLPLQAIAEPASPRG